MPIHEYRCEDCNKITEILLMGSSDKEVPVCRYCGSKKLVRLISKPAAVIMGTGRAAGTTCCGRTERCESPPCSTNGTCRRD